MGNHFLKSLPRSWLSLAARMYQASTSVQPDFPKGRGIVVMSISVIVDDKGEVVQYTPPRCEVLEPKRGSEKLLRLLTRTE